jgi:hypothetical protein
MTDRYDFDLQPQSHGWYGVLFMGEPGEVWVGAAHWDGAQWSENVSRAYARSAAAFETKEVAADWASAQPD